MANKSALFIGGTCPKCSHVHTSIVCICGCDISGELLKLAAPVVPTSVRYCGHEVPVGKACPECFPVAPAPVATAETAQNRPSEIDLVCAVLAAHQSAYAKFHNGEGRGVIESNEMAIGYASVELAKLLTPPPTGTPEYYIAFPTAEDQQRATTILATHKTGTPEPLRDELMQALTQWQIDERSGYDILASASLDRVRAALAAEQRKGQP